MTPVCPPGPSSSEPRSSFTKQRPSDSIAESTAESTFTKRNATDRSNGESPHGPNAGEQRQNTNSTQDSKDTQQSHTPSEGRKKLTDQVTSLVQRVSNLSLPKFRTLQSSQCWYWPAPKDEVGDLVDANRSCTDPRTEFKLHHGTIKTTAKSAVYAARLKNKKGLDEMFAAKEIVCDEYGPESKLPQLQQEYEILRSIEHNHIIAAVGSYHFDFPNRPSIHGLLLFPLAPDSLDRTINVVSEHNEGRHRADWTTHHRVPALLDHFACLCRAVMYLHEHEIKHRDVKPDNILVDKHGVVLLADFDISKKYSNREGSHTEGYSANTAKYAPASVANGSSRSYDWDVFALGCVFLEIATVAFGRTLDELRTFLGGKEYSVARDQDLIHKWMQELKCTVSKSLDKLSLPVREPPSGDPQLQLDTFLDHIESMIWANPTDCTTILEPAWRFFNTVASHDCPHCHPAAVSHHMPRDEESYSPRTENFLREHSRSPE